MSIQSVRAKFHCGDYQGCCEEASKVATATTGGGEVKSLFFRSLVHLDRVKEAQRLVTRGGGSAGEGSHLDQALLFYAQAYPHRHLPASLPAGGGDLAQLTESVINEEGEDERDEAAVILSLVHGWRGDLTMAYRLAAQAACLEAQLLLVTYLVGIQRFDLVDRKMEKLRRVAVDEVIYQVVEAEVAMAKGGKNIKDALYIYQQLSESLGTRGRTKKLLCAQVSALLLLDRLNEAEPLILEVLEMVRMRLSGLKAHSYSQQSRIRIARWP